MLKECIWLLQQKKKAFAQARADGSFRFVPPSNFPKKNYLTPVVEAGVVVLILSDKPKSPKQKYKVKIEL